MKKANSHSRRFEPLPRPLCLAVALAFAPSLGWSQALPTAPNVARGSATISRPGAGQMLVQQGSQNAVINWQSFSIGAGGQVTFQQPNAGAVALNRVVGTDASSIMGTLIANGRIFLVNPNGVLFGFGSSVSVGGLVASTLDLADDDFMAAKYSFTRGTAAAAGVTNQGTLQAATGGVIALIGSTVDNSGSITASQGTAALAAGKTVTLDLVGDGLSQLRVTEADLGTLVSNSGTLVADGGRAMMLADTTTATGFVVNQSGVVRARSLTTGPGGVVIAGGAGDVSVTGSVDTTGGAGQKGGDVSITGRNVGLLDSGRIDASGGAGGGQVTLVGTPVDGVGGMAVVASAAGIVADATAAGDGGRVDLIGSSVRLNGNVSSRGADGGGDGGVVKLTASDGLDTSGMRVDASAPKGQAGTLNIDPYDVTIAPGSSGGGGGPPVLTPFSPLTNSTVYANDIDNVLNGTVGSSAGGTSVTISTGSATYGGYGTITLGYGSTPAQIVRSTGTNTVTLRFDAGYSIQTGGAGLTIDTLSTAAPLNVEMSANPVSSGGTPSYEGGINLSGIGIKTNGGYVTLGAGGVTTPLAASSSLFNVGVLLDGTTIDTRVNQSDTLAGGGVNILGNSATTDGVRIVNASTISTSTGGISVTGNNLNSLTGGVSSGAGIYIDTNSAVKTTTGAVSLSGTSRASGVADGIYLTGASQINTMGGNITMVASGAGAGAHFDAGSSVAAGSGTVSITGTSSGNDTSVERAAVDMNNATISGGGGQITLTGNGGGSSDGVAVRNGSSVTNTLAGGVTFSGGSTIAGSILDHSSIGVQNGAVVIGGTNTALASGRAGVEINAGTIVSTGSGGVSVGGASTDAGDNDGVAFTNGSVIHTVTGTVGLGGNGGGAGTLVNHSTISTLGDVNIGGTTHSSTGGRAGVEIDAGVISSSTGAIQIGGLGVATNDGAAVTNGSQISNGSGSLTIGGTGDGTGMILQTSNISTSGGNILLMGIGTNASGLNLLGAQVSAATGNIDVRGGVSGASSLDGFSLGSDGAGNGSYLHSATGNVSVAGSVNGVGSGVVIDSSSYTSTTGNIAGSNVTIRAGNAGTGTAFDSLELFGSIKAAGVVNIRPGGVDATGALIDRSDLPIFLGHRTYGGLSLTYSELQSIAASTVVLGSDLFARPITVVNDPLPVVMEHSVRAEDKALPADTISTNLTLQTGAGGSIAIGAPLTLSTGNTLALVTPGAVTQADTASLEVSKLLVRAGAATLTASGNDVGTLAAVMGSGALSYVNSSGLALGPVAASGVAGTAGAPVALDASSLTGGTMLVQTMAGNLTLAGNITADVLDLVTPGVFDNSSGSTIIPRTGGPGDRWHLWARTWIGENSGGLVGSDPLLPNVYGCAYGSSCTVSPGAMSNAFIYSDKPVATFTVGDQTRTYGDSNAAFTVSVSGLAKSNDLAANILAGAPATAATVTSNVGTYVISGAGLTANAGYGWTTQDGTLAITPATLTYNADPKTRSIVETNPLLTGNVTGFRNSDTLGSATTGTLTWSTTAVASSLPGAYPITGNGLAALNYVFVQAPGNARALTVTPPTPLDQILAVHEVESVIGSVEPLREDESTYVYDHNLGKSQMCVPDSPMTLPNADYTGVKDLLTVEWSRVRTRPNVVTCFATGSKGGCSDF